MALTALLLTGCWITGDSKDGDALRRRPPSGFLAQEWPSGSTLTIAQIRLEVTSLDPVTLVSVEPVDADNLGVVGYRLLGPSRRGGFQTKEGFNTSRGMAVEGAVLRPADVLPGQHNYELLVGVRLDYTEFARLSSLLVTYREGSKTYHQRIDYEALFCVPDMTFDECESHSLF